MAVYVDNARNRYGRMIMSHMVADDIDELHKMADRIGIDRRHFQGKSNIPHYDICQAKRRLAIEFGASPVSCRMLIEIVRDYGGGACQRKPGERFT